MRGRLRHIRNVRRYPVNVFVTKRSSHTISPVINLRARPQTRDAGVPPAHRRRCEIFTAFAGPAGEDACATSAAPSDCWSASSSQRDPVRRCLLRRTCESAHNLVAQASRLHTEADTQPLPHSRDRQAGRPRHVCIVNRSPVCVLVARRSSHTTSPKVNVRARPQSCGAGVPPALMTPTIIHRTTPRSSRNTARSRHHRARTPAGRATRCRRCSRSARRASAPHQACRRRRTSGPSRP